MASAKRIPLSAPSIELLLTAEEAQAVFLVCGSVTGDEVTTWRKYTGAVYYALNAAGVDYPQKDGKRDYSTFKNQLTPKTL